MATHQISLTLTTEQLIHLNQAMNDTYDCNFDALQGENGFDNERLPLLRQCEALQTFMDSIKNIVSGVEDAK